MYNSIAWGCGMGEHHKGFNLIIFLIFVALLWILIPGCSTVQQPSQSYQTPTITPSQTSPSITPPTALPSTGKYVGSKNSNIYHRPSCQWAQKISKSNEIWFSSIADAEAKGYRPCKVCKP